MATKKIDQPAQLQERLLEFAVRVIKVTDVLPKSTVGCHIAGQLLRCGTSPAPNYAEARAAESRADFVHKLKVILKELNEAAIWLQMAYQANLVTKSRLAPLIDESQQLARIINASITTSRRRKHNLEV